MGQNEQELQKTRITYRQFKRKRDKQKANRRLRKKYKKMLKTKDWDNFIQLDIRDVSDTWMMQKDGMNRIYVPDGSIWYKKAKRK